MEFLLRGGARPRGLSPYWFLKRQRFVCAGKGRAEACFFLAAVGLGLVIIWGGAKGEARIGCCLGGGA